jgi:pseudouridine-5'-phosphate glycosidase
MRLVVCNGWSDSHSGEEKVLRIEQEWDRSSHTKTHVVCCECKSLLVHKIPEWINRLVDNEEDSGNT